jgi:DNA-binding XRE family transcriptional regulator
MKKPQELSDEQQELLFSIGLKIKDLRIRKKFSYETMAKEIGIARNTYNLIELGKKNFQLSTIHMILKYHHLSFSQFFNDLESDPDFQK